jgi:hypothetical protein
MTSETHRSEAREAPDTEAVIEKVSSEHGIFAGGYTWWCCGPHPGTNEPDEDHSHIEFEFGKKGSRKATRHLLRAILAASQAPTAPQDAASTQEHRPIIRGITGAGDDDAGQLECACGWLWTAGDPDEPEGSAFMRHALSAAPVPPRDSLLDAVLAIRVYGGESELGIPHLTKIYTDDWERVRAALSATHGGPS